MKLNGKVAVITGGSGGIGRVIAEVFLREGAYVVVVDRNKEGIRSAVKKIGGGIDGVVADVADYASITKTIARIAKKYHHIDVLINCAGIQAPIGTFMQNDMKEWERNIGVNLFGTVHACKAVLPFMARKKSGAIINFSGGGATGSRPHFSAYAAAKTAVVRFTEILSDELAPYGIRVNAVAPGAVNTAMLEEVLRVGAHAGEKELSDARKRKKEGGTPPELVASLAVFLASDDSNGLTGRLVSAPWDDWKHWDDKTIKKLTETDKLKLRRVQLK